MVKIINDKILNALGNDSVPRVLVGNKTDLIYDRFNSSLLLFTLVGLYLLKKEKHLLIPGAVNSSRRLPNIMKT
jgi:GTPase SAR1 family protein